MTKLDTIIAFACFGLLLAQPARGEDTQSLTALIDGKQGTYHFLSAADHPWRLCVLLPHAKDHYYWEAAWGLVDQARKMGAEIGIYQAGGYEAEHIAEQKRQIRSCLDNHADAVLIAAIDSAGLGEEEKEMADRKIVMIDLLNELDGALVAAHSHHDLVETGRAAGAHAIAAAGMDGRTVAWFPGPAGPRWSQEFDLGVHDAFKANHGETFLSLIDAGWAPTDRESQATLVRRFAENAHADVILANAIAAVAAARFFAHRTDAPREIISLYTTDEVIEEMRKGTIGAMVASSPAEQSRIAVDLAIRALEHKPYPHAVSLPIFLVTKEGIDSYVRETRAKLPDARIPLPPLPAMATSARQETAGAPSTPRIP